MDDQPTSLRPAFVRMLDPGHELSDAEVLAAYVDGTLDEERLDRLEQALADDAALRAEVQALRDVRADMHADGTLRGDGPAQVLPFTPRLAPASPPKWAMAAILLVGLGLGLTGYRFLGARDQGFSVAGGPQAPAQGLNEVPGSAAEPRADDEPLAAATEPSPADAATPLVVRAPSAPTRLALRDGRGTFAIDATGKPAGVAASVDPIVVAMVTAGAELGSLPLPPSFGLVQSRAGRLMGGALRQVRPAPIAPRSTFVRDARPTFSWAAIPDATSYRLLVVDASLDIVADSGELRDTRWTPESVLPRGVVLTWQVTATTPAGRVSAPEPPAAEARFQVLTADATDALIADLARCGDSRIARAFVLSRAGLAADAVLLFEDIAAQNPGDAAARRWLRTARTNLGQ